MALYTCEDVINAAKRLIEEASDTNVVTKNQLIQFVSDSQIRVANETQCLQSSGDITLAAETISYTPPTGTESVIDVLYKYPSGYDSLKRIEPGQGIPPVSDNSLPYQYFYRASKIWIFPYMDADPEITSATVIFAKLPVAITALSDSLTIPDSFQTIVPYLVAKLVAIKDNQMIKADALDRTIKELYAGGITTISRQASAQSGGNAPAAT